MQILVKKTGILITYFSLLLISTCAFAYPQQKAATSADPAYAIHTALEKITTFSSNSDKVKPIQLRGFIENEIIPHFDFNNMSHWITGRYADNMTEKDKAAFQRNLRETFLSSLARHLGSFDAKNTRVRFQKVRYRGQDEAFVNTTIYRPDSIPVHLDFRMKREGKDWKIIDVKANGSSAVMYYRNHFIAELRTFQRRTPRRY